MHSIDRFHELAAEERFKGWPLVGKPTLGHKIPWFGQTLEYELKTPNGFESYTSIIRHFGWAVVFGITNIDGRPHVVTLCQWKPGLNQASWELPPGGIGRLNPEANMEELATKTKAAFLKETGLGNGFSSYLGHVLIETGKYRGAGPDDHGLAAHLFLMEDLQVIQDAREPNSNEIMETIMVPLDEFPDVLDSDLFVETSAVACAYKALLKLRKLS